MAINFRRLEDITRALKPLNQTGKSFHTCFVYHGSKLICITNNDYTKLHPYHKWSEYTSRKPGNNYKAGLHAESRALIRLGMEDCSHLHFINVRIDNNGNPANSKACPNCYRLLRQIGYKYLTYYDGTQYVKEKY